MAIVQQARRHDTVYAAIDFDQFGAQVFTAYNLCQLTAPFAVACQNAQSHKSAVWSMSPGARKLGIECGMPVMLVKKRFPQVTIVIRARELEQSACDEIRRVLEEFSPEYEISQSGKCLLDLSRTPAARQMTWETIGNVLRCRISLATRLPAIALGISRSRLLAKILAKQARPDGVLVCQQSEEPRFLDTLDCRLLPDLSPHCRETLKKYGIVRMSQLKKLGKEAIVKRFGNEGEKLYGMTSGLYAKTNAPSPSGVRVETVLDKDINDMGVLVQQVKYAADKFCYRVKNYHSCIRRFTMIVTYTDNKKAQKSVTLPAETDDYRCIADRASRLFLELYQRRVAIKSLTILTKQTERDRGQVNIFESAWEKKQKRLADGIVTVRNKFQFESVVSGTNVQARHTQISS